MKSVIIYTYFSSPSSDYNLCFFVKKELSYKDNIDYIIVINGYEYDKKIQFPKLDNLTILKRENIGYDFGGHNHALEYMKINAKTYDYYFFMNSGVIGPILPHSFTETHWTNIFIKKINDSVKLVGTTIVCLPHSDAGGYGPKVEGFFFMVDNIGLNLLKNQTNIFCNHPNKFSAIVNGEYGLSNCILKHGYSIDCMLPKYQNIDWRQKDNYNLNHNKHPSRKNSFYGHSINPYDVIFHKWYWHNAENVNFEIIRQYVDDFNSSQRLKRTTV
uniref:Glycosyltransferase n=1 Tax=viral metagenome TaxID=1070528 RepID=A0A6C0JYD2_9ZZZZ